MFDTIPLLDSEMVEQLVMLSDDDPAFAKSLLSNLKSDYQEAVTLFESDIDLERAAKIAHKLAGASSNMGGQRFSHAMSYIEQNCRSDTGFSIEQLRQDLQVINAIAEETFTELAKHYK